jgi:hypothetical protein
MWRGGGSSLQHEGCEEGAHRNGVCLFARSHFTKKMNVRESVEELEKNKESWSLRPASM